MKKAAGGWRLRPAAMEQRRERRRPRPIFNASNPAGHETGIPHSVESTNVRSDRADDSRKELGGRARRDLNPRHPPATPTTAPQAAALIQAALRALFTYISRVFKAFAHSDASWVEGFSLFLSSSGPLDGLSMWATSAACST